MKLFPHISAVAKALMVVMDCIKSANSTKASTLKPVICNE